MKKQIEHRFVSIEKVVDKKNIDEKIGVIPCKKMSWYALRGYEVFDYTESLNMDSLFYNEETEFWLKT